MLAISIFAVALSLQQDDHTNATDRREREEREREGGRAFAPRRVERVPLAHALTAESELGRGTASESTAASDLENSVEAARSYSRSSRSNRGEGWGLRHGL